MFSRSLSLTESQNALQMLESYDIICGCNIKAGLSFVKEKKTFPELLFYFYAETFEFQMLKLSKVGWRHQVDVTFV